MNFSKAIRVFIAVLAALQFTIPSLVYAQQALPAEQPDSFLAGPEVSAHTAWMLVCSAMVLFMTAPGLALYYGGLVRKKNVLSVFMQCIFLMGLMTVIWAVYGYSLAFGGTGPVIGNFKYIFMQGVARTWSESAGQPMTPMHDVVPTLPRMLHMIFQGMFFIITPSIICGAFAERMRFSAMVAFSVLWGTFVYCPLAHWVWGGGLLSYGGPNSILGGALDFAGGTVVHISSGVSALVAAYVIGPRLGHRHEPMPPHNLTYSAIGATMLWIGWFGFNAGSAKAADGLAINAFITTHFAAAAGAVAWAAIEWLKRGRPSLLGACSGAVAGLVCITPAAGHVGPNASLIMGACAGCVCYLSCSQLKARCGYDDTLDAFGVHGVGGTLGAILTGVFATRAVWNINDGQPVGMIEGNFFTILGQLSATAITWLFAAVVSYALLKLIDITIGLRVPAHAERQGLDITQHGEEGYIFL
ncbi:MAG: ammonium transporter [Pirellulaceae bacterium]|nr:ammonium transporter [Pirellulaceae bacterium]